MRKLIVIITVYLCYSSVKADVIGGVIAGNIAADAVRNSIKTETKGNSIFYYGKEYILILRLGENPEVIVINKKNPNVDTFFSVRQLPVDVIKDIFPYTKTK